MLALTVCEILLFKIVNLENLGKGHVIDKRDLRHSIANNNSIKVALEHFCDLENIGQGNDVQYSQ